MADGFSTAVLRWYELQLLGYMGYAPELETVAGTRIIDAPVRLSDSVEVSAGYALLFGREIGAALPACDDGEAERKAILRDGLIVLASVIVVACNEAFGIYRRWWRYATSQDLVPVTVSIGVATVALMVGFGVTNRDHFRRIEAPAGGRSRTVLPTLTAAASAEERSGAAPHRRLHRRADRGASRPMALDLFAGIRVSDYETAKSWIDGGGHAVFAGAVLEMGTRPGPVKEQIAAFQIRLTALIREFTVTATPSGQ